MVLGHGLVARVAVRIRFVTCQERGQGFGRRMIGDQLLEGALPALVFGAGAGDGSAHRRVEVEQEARAAVAVQRIAIAVAVDQPRVAVVLRLDGEPGVSGVDTPPVPFAVGIPAFGELGAEGLHRRGQRGVDAAGLERRQADVDAEFRHRSPFAP